MPIPWQEQGADADAGKQGTSDPACGGTAVLHDVVRAHSTPQMLTERLHRGAGTTNDLFDSGVQCGVATFHSPLFALSAFNPPYFFVLPSRSCQAADARTLSPSASHDGAARRRYGQGADRRRGGGRSVELVEPPLQRGVATVAGRRRRRVLAVRLTRGTT